MDDAFNHHLSPGGGGLFRQELLIQLKLRNIQVFQGVQGGIAAAEIIHGYGKSHIMEFTDLAEVKKKIHNDNISPDNGTVNMR